MSNPLRIVEEAGKFTDGASHGTIVVTCDLDDNNAVFDALMSTAAVNLAMNYGVTKGMASPGLNGSKIGPYPVNSEGVPLDEVAARNLPEGDPATQAVAYRIDIPLMGRKGF